MKTLQKILALLLVVAMCACLFAACSSNKTPAQTDNDTDNGDTPDTGDEEELPFDGEEVVIYMMYTQNFGDIEEVEAAINEITSARYGFTVALNGFDMGSYANQLSLAISGGEQVDLASVTPIPPSTFASVTSAGQAMDISGMIDEYCPDMLELMGSYMGAFQIGEGVYGLPVARQKASSFYFCYRTDIAEELGIVDAINSAETWDDLAAVFETVKNGSDLSPLGGSGCLNGRITGLWDTEKIAITPYDGLGDTMYLVYGDENGTVQKTHETAEYKALMERLAAWNDAGFVWGDTQTNKDLTATQLIDQGVIWAEFVPTEFGSENDTARAAAHPVTYRKISDGMITSASMTTWSFFVPVCAKEPEAALAFYNALYTDADLMNLMDWGIQGKHYELNADGEACYIGGATGTDNGYHNDDWMVGNSFLLAPWEGQGSDFRTAAQENLENSAASNYLGFALDSSSMSDMIAALSSVYGEYEDITLSGFYTDSIASEYEGKLASAGIDDYIAAIQAQVDTWMGK